jgi:hypothetical protein
VSPERADLVWKAIALHSSAGIATRMAAEIALVHLGADTSRDRTHDSWRRSVLRWPTREISYAAVCRKLWSLDVGLSIPSPG